MRFVELFRAISGLAFFGMVGFAVGAGGDEHHFILLYIVCVLLYMFSVIVYSENSKEIRGEGWPASFEGRHFVIHAYLMMLLGWLTTQHALILRGIFIALGTLLFSINWDLFVFDPKEKYQEKTLLIRQKRQQLETSTLRPSSKFLALVSDPSWILVVLTVLLFTFTVIANLSSFMETWSRLFQ